MNTIYALTDPITHEARYIGLTSMPLMERLRGHCSCMSSKRVREWVWALDDEGKVPEIIALEVEPIREKAAEAELFWMHYMQSLGARLLNYHIRKEKKQTATLYLTPHLVDLVNKTAVDKDIPVAQLLYQSLRALELQEAHRDKELKP